MGTSNEELLSSIRSYQRSVDKYASLGSTYKLIGIIEKLKRLPIATAHLEETGIGRTVNGLRKLGGEVGDAAKGLVGRWKEMVLQEEAKAKESAVNEIPKEEFVTENDNGCYDEKEDSCREEEISCRDEENDCREEEDSRYLEKQSSSSHRSSDTERKNSERHEKDKNKYSSNNGSRSSHEKKDKQMDVDSSSKKRRKSNSSSDEHNSKRHRDSSGFESEEGVYEEKHKSTSKRNKESESSEIEEEEDRKYKSKKSESEEGVYEEKHKSTSKRNKESESSEIEEEEDRKHKSKKSRHSKDRSDSEDSYKRHKSSKSSRDDSSRKSKSREKTENKKRDYDSSSDRETDKSKSKHRFHSKSKRESDCAEDKSGSRHKSKKNYESSSDNEEARHKSKHDSKPRHDKDSSKSRDSKSHASRSDKPERKDKKESKRDESKEKHSHKKTDSRTVEEKHRKSKDEKETSKKQKSSSSSRPEESSKPSSSSSKHKSSSEKKKDKVKLPKPVNTEKIMNGIDSGSGASFAEALGMCGPMVNKSSSTSKSSSSSKKKSSSLPNYEKPRSSSSYVRSEKTEMIEEEDTVPTLLKEQPREPININISSLLPDITPNYRPVGFPIDTQPKRVISQDEALSQVISNKNMRTKVYSGNKSFGKVETLFDLCVRILQDNIDALEYTGGVPYLILKPVLERATPDQLFNMEHHNPYLIEDTDELWQLHCQKEFRNKKLEELESWREMYMRCLNEREARLNAITANIKHAQDKSTPIRTTKLAYIDSVVKPPRNIARKQAKNGILFDKKPAQTPASRVASLASHGDTGKVAVPNPGNRAVERSSSSSAAAMKPKKAPLMAKTLSFLKNRFRR